MDNKTRSYWISSTEQPLYPAFQGERIRVDVAIIGAGISGLTAAILLKRAGKTVAVLEQNRVAGGESGRTTAHITELVDSRYSLIESRFGLDGSRLVAQSSRAAIEKIAALSETLGISCGFRRVPAFLYAERLRDVWNGKREVKAARRAGLIANWTRDVPLPFPTRGALRLDNQAQFNPRQYLLGLAAAIPGNGSFLFENSPVQEFREAEPCEIVTAKGTIRATELIVATHSPNSSPYLLQLRLGAYRTYVIAIKPGRPIPAGLYWDMQDPYHYSRENDGTWLIGGEDHKTGLLTDTETRFRRLRRYIASRFGTAQITHEWSGQILEPIDGLPYIGLNPLSHHVYVTTGYSGNGMTFGTISGMLISDLILKRQNAWEPLYRPSRIRPLSFGVQLVTENIEYPFHLVRDRIEPLDRSRASEISPGEARIVKWNNQPTAVYRETNGRLHAVSAVCTHMGCHVHWNDAERSWDCPCHGSRFDVDGKIVNGPAMRGLHPVSLQEALKRKGA